MSNKMIAEHVHSWYEPGGIFADVMVERTDIAPFAPARDMRVISVAAKEEHSTFADVCEVVANSIRCAAMCGQCSCDLLINQDNPVYAPVKQRLEKAGYTIVEETVENPQGEIRW